MQEAYIMKTTDVLDIIGNTLLIEPKGEKYHCQVATVLHDRAERYFSTALF